MIAGALHLTREDIKALKITDSYSLHRVIYSLFEDVRTLEQKTGHEPSGFLFADKGGDFKGRNILFLSDREPTHPEFGQVQTRAISDAFLQHNEYRFEVTLNPTKRDKNTAKTVPIKGREQIAAWFLNRASASWGFDVQAENIQIDFLSVKQFTGKNDHAVTLGSATIQGLLKVVDREKFIKSFKQGVGRGRAFGFGLLQIVPVSNPFQF